jgi:hypothetical protein
MKISLAKLDKEFWWKRINKVFPPKTIAILQTGIKIGELQQPHFLIWDWHQGRDYAAFAYELARRADRNINFRPYPKLNPDESQFLFRTFGAGKDRKSDSDYIYSLSSTPIDAQPGYSVPVIWRLDLPIGTLKKSFEKFIRKQSSEQSIKPRLKPGSTSKNPPWIFAEYIDYDDYGCQIQNDKSDPQRSLRKARELAKTYLQDFKSKLKSERENNPNSRACLWAELHY